MSKRHFERHIASLKNQFSSANTNTVNNSLTTKESSVQELTCTVQNNNMLTQESSASCTSNDASVLVVNSTNVLSSVPSIILSKNIDLSINSHNMLNDIVKNNKPLLVDKLRLLISKYHVSHHFVNDLLNILREENLAVPKDVRTILRTPTTHNHNILNIDPGTYIHFGVRNMLSPVLSSFFDDLNKTSLIELSCNIDGLPISKSSKSCFWPILISFVNCNIPNMSKIVVPVGIYYHKSKKPSSASEYLSHFISEMLTIIDSGLYINDKRFNIQISQVVCDAPAKAFILNVKGHNGYHACNSCIVEGSFLNNRMSYLDLDSHLRTNASFRNKLDENYHKGPSPLEAFNFNITEVVVLEYMHNICLGVMKKLLRFWIKGSKPVRLQTTDIDLINSDLVNLGQYLPSEFSRRPRSLGDIEFWKASEFRCFILYIGPIVLKGRLKKKLYSHFMTLHCAIRLLMFKDTCTIFNDQAKAMLISFVSKYSILYGIDSINYNVHGLIHLANFVIIHGPLDNFSAFKFENYLGFLKKCLKNARYPLEDIYNRVTEYNQINCLKTDLNYPILKKEIDYGLLYQQNVLETCYESIILPNFSLSCNNKKDNTFLLDSNDIIVSIKRIIQFSDFSIKLEVSKFNESYSMFNIPIDSSTVGCFYVNLSKLSSCYLIPLSSISKKCFIVPTSNNIALIFTLLHTL